MEPVPVCRGRRRRTVAPAVCGALVAGAPAYAAANPVLAADVPETEPQQAEKTRTP